MEHKIMTEAKFQDWFLNLTSAFGLPHVRAKLAGDPRYRMYRDKFMSYDYEYLKKIFTIIAGEFQPYASNPIPSVPFIQELISQNQQTKGKYEYEEIEDFQTFHERRCKMLKEHLIDPLLSAEQKGKIAPPSKVLDMRTGMVTFCTAAQGMALAFQNLGKGWVDHRKPKEAQNGQTSEQQKHSRKV
jgi:hypothetical protein